MTKNRRVYRLSPSQLSAETIAVTFAKTSRSPQPFDEIASELNEEKSSKFSEKWIVGYGHSSVAEHAVLHLALENVSRLAIENIESNRLASYTEKSTRYQEWDPDAYVVPNELLGTKYLKEYLDSVNMLFESYAIALPVLRNWTEKNTPHQDGESEKAWLNRTRIMAIDICRFLLPAAAMANVGVTINARALEYAIKKMLSSELEEIRAIGAEVKLVATQELPTLVKYANPMKHFEEIRNELSRPSVSNYSNSPFPCSLLAYDSEGEQKILASVLYRFGQLSYEDCLNKVTKMTLNEKNNLAENLFRNMTDFDVPLRELEYTSYLFEAVMDQGAYFEFKRHRMMSQTTQSLSTNLGFATPRGFLNAGIGNLYKQAMIRIAKTYQHIASWDPSVASYVVPNGYYRRVLFSLNLREAFHFLRLRCNPGAHFSIRLVGRRIYEKINSVHPILSKFICVNCDETSDSIIDSFFSNDMQ